MNLNPQEDVALEMQDFGQGFVVFGSNCLPFGEPHLLIGDVYVRKPKRRTGIGSGIVDALIANAKRAGLRAAYAAVDSNQKNFSRALSFVRALGFKFHSATTGSVIFRKDI